MKRKDEEDDGSYGGISGNVPLWAMIKPKKEKYHFPWAYGVKRANDRNNRSEKER